MSDEALIVDKTGSVFLAGSHLIKAAIGEEIDNESLGGGTKSLKNDAQGKTLSSVMLRMEIEL